MKLVLLLPALFFGFTLTSNSVAGTYTVKKGDSLRKIAQKEHCTVAQLEALNEPDYPLIIGQVLRTPDKGSIVQGAAETAAVNAKHPKQAQAAEDKQAETAEQLRQEWAQQDALDTQRRQKETDARQAASDAQPSQTLYAQNSSSSKGPRSFSPPSSDSSQPSDNSLSSDASSGAAPPSSTSAPSDCLREGLVAERAGNLKAAYHWYLLGTGLDLSSAENIARGEVPKLAEPAESYEFKCLISLARVAEKRVIANPSDYCDNNNDQLRHYVIADLAYRSAQGIVLGKVGTDGAYDGYTNDRLERIMEQSSAFFHANNRDRADAEAARMADEENTMNAIAEGATAVANALNSGSRGGASGSASGNQTPKASGNPEAANQCNNDPEYIRLMGQCKNNTDNNMGAVNQAPCYQAAVYLLNCYIKADPNNPNVNQWIQTRDQNQQALDSLNTQQSVPSIRH